MTYLIQANEQDINTISSLAETIWNAHYIAIISQEQIDYMLERMYSKNSLLSQMQEKHQFYLINQNEQNVGFLSVSSDNKTDYFLHKFYILPSQANKGLGTETLRLLNKEINPKSLTLTVNRKNYKSINFYFKNGFVIDRVEDFDIGNGYEMNDFVMKKQIAL